MIQIQVDGALYWVVLMYVCLHLVVAAWRGWSEHKREKERHALEVQRIRAAIAKLEAETEQP